MILFDRNLNEKQKKEFYNDKYTLNMFHQNITIIFIQLYHIVNY